ncbi:MAG: EAL domain-containing protein, partial [Gammaproteobacteria bacterium]
MITLAHRLKRNVVAEGVETEAQATLLRAYECDAGQGYLYSRPLPTQNFAEWVRRMSRAATRGHACRPAN